MSNASFRLESFRPWNPFQDKAQPLRDSLDICRYPSLVSMTPTPPPSNPIDPVSKSQKSHAHKPGRHPLPARPPLEVCLDGGQHSDAQPTRHEPEDLSLTTFTNLTSRLSTLKTFCSWKVYGASKISILLQYPIMFV